MMYSYDILSWNDRAVFIGMVANRDDLIKSDLRILIDIFRLIVYYEFFFISSKEGIYIPICLLRLSNK